MDLGIFFWGVLGWAARARGPAVLAALRRVRVAGCGVGPVDGDSRPGTGGAGVVRRPEAVRCAGALSMTRGVFCWVGRKIY